MVPDYGARSVAVKTVSGDTSLQGYWQESFFTRLKAGVADYGLPFALIGGQYQLMETHLRVRVEVTWRAEGQNGSSGDEFQKGKRPQCRLPV